MQLSLLFSCGVYNVPNSTRCEEGERFGIPRLGTHHSHSVPFSFAHCVSYETNIFALSSFIYTMRYACSLVGPFGHSLDVLLRDYRNNITPPTIPTHVSTIYMCVFSLSRPVRTPPFSLAVSLAPSCLFSALHFRYLVELRSRSYLSFDIAAVHIHERRINLYFIHTPRYVHGERGRAWAWYAFLLA